MPLKKQFSLEMCIKKGEKAAQGKHKLRTLPIWPPLGHAFVPAKSVTQKERNKKQLF
jgi:hypothetical protein